jgi:hypothetical protein
LKTKRNRTLRTIEIDGSVRIRMNLLPERRCLVLCCD